VKCGLRQKMGTAAIIQGPLAADGSTTTPCVTDYDKQYELTVTVDLATGSVTLEGGGATVKAKLDRPIKSITHVGYCLKGTIVDFSPIEEAIEGIRQGEIVIVVDDQDRENEGDMIFAAEKVTPEKINFITRYGRGLVCTPITEERAGELDLSQMARKNTCRYGTAFTISIDLISSETTTGISAHDRAATVRGIVDPDVGPDDFARPGHIFPLVARDGGVLRRAGTQRR